MRALRRFRPIHLLSLLLALACLETRSASAQSDLAFEPYSVYVAQEEAFARCGPSGEYYRTDPLRHGQSLQVYAETEDGWLGIRPPDDSFCWIPAETVEMDSDDTGTVIEDRTVAWIGTHLGRARTYRWQVQLAKSEPVTVLGRSEREGPDGPQLWYRIVPPSGEFRWVHRDQVVTSSEELVASRVAAESTRDQRAGAQTAPAADRAATASSSPTAGTPAPKLIASSGTSIVQSQQAAGGRSEDWRSNDARSAVGEASTGSQTEAAPQVAPQPTVAEAETVTDAMQRGGLLASVEFLSRPRLLDIGGGPSAPRANETASDANWVAGVARPALAAHRLPRWLCRGLPCRVHRS